MNKIKLIIATFCLLLVGCIYSQPVLDSSIDNSNYNSEGWHKYISPGINFSYNSKEGIKFTGWQISIGVFNRGPKGPMATYCSLSIGQDAYHNDKSKYSHLNINAGWVYGGLSYGIVQNKNNFGSRMSAYGSGAIIFAGLVRINMPNNDKPQYIYQGAIKTPIAIPIIKNSDGDTGPFGWAL